MSYEDTECPCGGRKPPNTMLCGECERELAARREMATLHSSDSPDIRRQAAIILLTLARKKNRSIDRKLLRGK